MDFSHSRHQTEEPFIPDLRNAGLSGSFTVKKIVLGVMAEENRIVPPKLLPEKQILLQLIWYPPYQIVLMG